MDRIVQFSLFLALCLHAFLFFGISGSGRTAVPRAPAEKPHVEVELVAPPPVEELPPPPEPVVPETIEPPPDSPTPVPEPPPEVKPEPAPEPQPVKALPVTVPVAASDNVEFAVAATTNLAATAPLDIPLSPPVPEVVEPELPATTIVKAEARYRRNPEPPYPLQAKRRRQEGLVLLSVLLDTKGIPVKVEVKQSSGFALLDNAASEGIKRWEFEPATLNGQHVASEVEVPVRFRLR